MSLRHTRTWTTRRPRGVAARAAAGVAAGAGGALLLGRMRREVLTEGRLQPATTAAMYAVYTAHLTATAVALARDAGRLPVPRPVRRGGVALVALGAGVTLAGMGRLASPGQVSGTEPGEVIADGIYQFSRNPQYVGYVVALSGLGLARRSPGALALAALAAVVYRWWVPIEERHLDQTFGARYRAYRRRTPRWLGHPDPHRQSPRSPPQAVGELTQGPVPA